MSAGEAGRHGVGFLDLLYLIGYIAYGLHLWYKIRKIKEIYRKPIDLHPGLGNSLAFAIPIFEMPPL